MKTKGTFRFNYIEIINGAEVENTCIVETNNLVKTIGRFGSGRVLVDLDVKQVNASNTISKSVI